MDFDFKSEQFSEYSFVCSFACRGRNSGGVMFFFGKKFSNFINSMKVEYENMIVLQIDKFLFHKDIILIGLRVSLPSTA